MVIYQTQTFLNFILTPALPNSDIFSLRLTLFYYQIKLGRQVYGEKKLPFPEAIVGSALNTLFVGRKWGALTQQKRIAV